MVFIRFSAGIKLSSELDCVASFLGGSAGLEMELSFSGGSTGFKHGASSSLQASKLNIRSPRSFCSTFKEISSSFVASIGTRGAHWKNSFEDDFLGNKFTI